LEDFIEGAMVLNSYLRITQEFDFARRGRFPQFNWTPEDDAWNALYCAVHRRWLEASDETLAVHRWRTATVVARDAGIATESPHEKSAQSGLLRDIFSNPFRPAALDPSWLTRHGGLLVSMAQKMYESCDFTDLPILADALEEAGCANTDMLAHCRQPGDHVRGCWVVDLLLGKG
jgi:hypothetical protein